VGGESDQQRLEVTPLLRAQRLEQLALGAPRRQAGSLHGPAAIGGELDAVSSPVGCVRRASQEPAFLELIQQRHEVAGLDPQRQRQISLGDRALRVEMVKDGELGPSKATAGEAPAETPGGGSGEAKDQQTEPRDQGCIAGLGLGLKCCVNGIHVILVTYTL